MARELMARELMARELTASGSMTRGLIVAAPRSGSGKTTVTLALLAALRQRGTVARAAKSGPDYIDPGLHEAVTGAPSPNLDSWSMSGAVLDSVISDAAQGAELLVIEASMGLFDGVDGPPGQRGSAADLARRYRLPVLLVLDVSGQSQSAAAVARGFSLHDTDVPVAGVVLNRVASDRHRDGVERAMRACGVTVFGSLRRDPTLAMPERHLGLVQAGEQGALPALIARLAAWAGSALDLDGLLDRAAPIEPRGGHAIALPPPGQRIALARDAAFTFAYPHLLAGWRKAGAEIHPFSPLADQAPDPACDSCWLPGGYPELHAGALAAAGRFRAGLARFAETRPVHGECGGHMVLGQTLEDATGATHRMAGLLGHSTSFAKRRMNLGYREATLLAAGTLGPAGAVLRGHEFHYASTTDTGPDAPFATLRDAAGRDLGPAGGQRRWVTGTFFHAIAAEDR